VIKRIDNGWTEVEVFQGERAEVGEQALKFPGGRTLRGSMQLASLAGAPRMSFDLAAAAARAHDAGTAAKLLQEAVCAGLVDESASRLDRIIRGAGPRDGAPPGADSNPTQRVDDLFTRFVDAAFQSARFELLPAVLEAEAAKSYPHAGPFWVYGCRGSRAKAEFCPEPKNVIEFWDTSDFPCETVGHDACIVNVDPRVPCEPQHEEPLDCTGKTDAQCNAPYVEANAEAMSAFRRTGLPRHKKTMKALEPFGGSSYLVIPLASLLAYRAPER
jgi:hypothetical protein